MKEGLIGPKDMKLFSVVDKAEDVCRLVREGWDRLRPAGFVERESS
jgi:predicted Rossmann-fold nucleotide-binding protein